MGLGPHLVELVEELEVVRAVLERLRHGKLDELLGVVHIVLHVWARDRVRVRVRGEG